MFVECNSYHEIKMYFLPKNIDFGVDFSYVKSFYGHFQPYLSQRHLRLNNCLIRLVIGSSISMLCCNKNT